MNEYCLKQGQGLKALAALPSSAPPPPGPATLSSATYNLQPAKARESKVQKPTNFCSFRCRHSS